MCVRTEPCSLRTGPVGPVVPDTFVLPPPRIGTKLWKRTMVTWATGEALHFFLAIYISYEIVLRVKTFITKYRTLNGGCKSIGRILKKNIFQHRCAY
jgi:hypothetical protein